jgi:DNA-binding NtrC family response regulator
MKTKIGLQQLIGVSPAFQAVLAAIPVISQSDVGVQISGETGTGKELCARAIHYLGPRAHKPFLPVNCGAIPAELVENELFGHVRGAFTGASLSHGGLISEADGGTLFLDEIDCLPLPAQIKLLRFVQEKEFRQLGSSRLRRADVRIIAATNSNLEQAVQAGTFRQDLFYRLNIVHLSLPPLRERREDILLLARSFLAQSAADEGKGISDFTSAAMEHLRGYGWPGNVRELENVVRRAVIFAKGDLIQDCELALPRPDAAAVLQESFKAEKAKVVAEFEKEYLQGLLRTHQGNITRASKAAQKNRRAFWELMRKYQIDVESFKSTQPPGHSRI